MKERIIKFVSVAILVVLAMTFYKLWQSSRDDVRRWEENYKQVQSDLSVIQLELGDFKAHMDQSIDSVLKVSKIKPKWVKSVTEITNNYSDTVYVVAKTKKINDSLYLWSDTVGCVKVWGDVRIEDNVPTVAIKEKTFKNKSTFIKYDARAKQPFPTKRFVLWHWRPFWKRKGRFVKEVTECGETKFHEVQVIR